MKEEIGLRPSPHGANSLTLPELAASDRLSALINGVLGGLFVLLGLGLIFMWLAARLFSHRFIELIWVLITGAGFMGTAGILLGVAGYHFANWRETNN